MTEHFVPQGCQADPQLLQAYREKIDSLKKIENDLPAVVIVHDIKDSTVVYMSEKGLRFLGMRISDLRQMGTEYYGRFFNPEDAADYVPKILGLLERNNNEEQVSYFQQVRQSEQHNWAWHLSSTKIFIRNLEQKPVFTITTSIAVDAMHHLASKADRLLEENNFLRRNKHVFASLTKREIEILRYMALGHSATEIAERLFISESTALTHRRNIKSKISAQSNYDITRFAQAFDLI